MSNIGARQVGEFSTISSRAMLRTPKNPADKATVVSIYPRDIREVKHTIQPSTFFVPAGTYDKPSVTVFEPSSWFRDMGEDQPMIEIPVNAAQIAHSIITDYCNGLLGCNMNDAMPGMFFIAGEVSYQEVMSKYKMKLAESQAKQKNWFSILVRLADSLWARSNNNPLVIWDEMRMAARELGVEKPWLGAFTMQEMVKCFACGNLRNPLYPVCMSCRAIDPEHPKAKDIKFAVA